MKKAPEIIGIIPARYASSRFPGKPLARIMDKPMIQWVHDACRDVFDNLVIATDDERIADAGRSFNAKVMLTSSAHRSGTERCLEVIESLERDGRMFDYAINIQGDEPLLEKAQLYELIHCLLSDNTGIATLARKFAPGEDPLDPNKVKTVLDASMNALYFSRSPIPFCRDNQDSVARKYLKHIGLYGYKTSVLKEICRLPEGILERSESLEQLRWLEHGYSIRIGITEYESAGIDTPEDLQRLISGLKKDS